MYLAANNLYGWEMSQNFPIGALEWKENTSKVDEDFIKNFGKDNEKGYILEADIDYPKNVLDLHNDLPFLTEKKLINAICMQSV